MSKSKRRNKPLISPEGWEAKWNEENAAIINHVVPLFQFAFFERGYDVFFEAWGEKRDPRKNYIGMGIRTEEEDALSTNSILSAFGFFLGNVALWPEDYIDHKADKAIEQYERFAAGEWPIKDIYMDDDLFARTANVEEVYEDETDMWGEPIIRPVEEIDPLS